MVHNGNRIWKLNKPAMAVKLWAVEGKLIMTEKVACARLMLCMCTQGQEIHMNIMSSSIDTES